MNTSPYLTGEEVCAELRIKLPTLLRMARRSRYPDLLHVGRGKYRVLRADHEAWKQGNSTSAVIARSDLLLEKARAQLMGAD